jgi:carbon starvation protein
MGALGASKDGHLTALNRRSRRLARGRFPSTTLDMNAAWWLLGALAVLALAYRYYSAFLAAKVLCLNDQRRTPAHEHNDGHNFHPTNKWVLFGHHFAAITGAGPLIGPVLAAQFGFLPGFLWILFGVVLGGAVHDFVILVASTRRGGRSLAEIARAELGPVLGTVTALAILFIIVIALAGLGNVVVGALAESPWGVFTVGLSIPIALLMGLHIYWVRGGTTRGIREATIVGVALLAVALVFGESIAASSYADWFRHSRTTLTLAIAAYGFVASVLPVWVLLCPRDYLSSYLKIGTIALLVVGILIVRPTIEMPAVTEYVHGGGPIIKGPLFPFVFVTIACGAISGFHALVSSGTTPKMIDRESHTRPIGYGSMLMEGLVGITALIAACVMPPEDYVAINTDPKIAMVASPATKGAGLAHSVEQLAAADAALTDHDRGILGLAPGQSLASLSEASYPASKLLALSSGTLARLDYSVDPAVAQAITLSDADFARLGISVKDLPALSRGAGEVVAARTGGGVSLAVGMARVFSGLPGMGTLLAYWYHFAIMFEALFILTTIDTGTRIGRFLMQEFLGRMSAELGRSSSRTGGAVASGLIVAGWAYFILTGSISTIWPMFGVANQLLACTALCVGTTIVLREAPKRHYALVTLLPLCFLTTTTLAGGIESVRRIYLPMTAVATTRVTGWVNAIVTTFLIVGVTFVIVGSARRWLAQIRGPAVPLDAPATS